MTAKTFIVDRPTFIGGVLLQPGSSVEVDNLVPAPKSETAKPDVAAGKMTLRDNLVPASKADEVVDYEVGDVAPRAPGTKVPQGMPPGSVQQGNIIVQPGVEGEPHAVLVGDKHETDEPKKRR